MNCNGSNFYRESIASEISGYRSPFELIFYKHWFGNAISQGHLHFTMWRALLTRPTRVLVALFAFTLSFRLLSIDTRAWSYNRLRTIVQNFPFKSLMLCNVKPWRREKSKLQGWYGFTIPHYEITLVFNVWGVLERIEKGYVSLSLEKLKMNFPLTKKCQEETRRVINFYNLLNFNFHW